MAWAPPPRTNSSPQVIGGGRSTPATGRSTPVGGGVRPTSRNASLPSRPSLSGSLARSSSPTRLALGPGGVDQKSIITLSQLCTEDLDAKMREKTALAKLVADLKKSKMQYDIKVQKKQKELDSTVVKTMDMEKKLSLLNNSNRVSGAEVVGIAAENERLRQDVEQLRANLQEAAGAYDRECEEIEGLKQALQATRKDLTAESKLRDTVQQDLRASRTAQQLMVNRLDDIERRSRVLKSCVANTINQ
eukprot:TRINITY_DN42566_c0_g1_i1.p1 TRINITY_DN42566_c0_g1~~TRINITY_DN42566_c0_g1_i1.p1  ORF type:complete len:261 (-),score=50.63 TRINITY_DN42566_c0_g1_i1:41-781(-)